MQTANDSLLKVSDLCAWYGAAQVLFGLDLQVGRGEVVALMGRNGAGKSTTLKAIMGMVEQRKGGVRFMGRDIARAEPHAIARAGLAQEGVQAEQQMNLLRVSAAEACTALAPGER